MKPLRSKIRRAQINIQNKTRQKASHNHIDLASDQIYIKINYIISTTILYGRRYEAI